MTLYVPAKEFEGELWVRATDFQKALAEAEQPEPDHNEQHLEMVEQQAEGAAFKENKQ